MTKCDVDIAAEVDVEIPFHDGDPAGVTWHGNYFRYFELARCALLDKLDYNYLQMNDSGYSWPVVDTRVKFAKPTVFRQRVKVKATLQEYDIRLKIAYLITDAVSGERLTKGYTVQVAVDQSTNEMCFASPKILIDKVRRCA